MPSTTGERLIGKTLSEIAPNHVARYEWASQELLKRIKPGASVLDAACGCGYGSRMLAEAGFIVDSFDISHEAETWQRNFLHENVKFRRDNILNIKGKYDAVVSIETIEHIETASQWIGMVGEMTDIFVGTVPNEEVVSFSPERDRFHFRHYTKSEVIELLDGWGVESWATQYAKWENYEMRPGDDGMTLGFGAVK